MSKKKLHPGHEDADGRMAEHYLAGHGGLWFDFDQYAVAAGAAAPDRLQGGETFDYFFGRAAPDRLAGAGGDDVLYGGRGDDLVTGGMGMDMLEGGMGKDKLYGGMMEDTLKGGEGDDFLDEGAGHGDLDGGPGNDTLVGGPGPDAFEFEPGSGNDVIRDFTAGPGMFDHLAMNDLRWEDLAVTQETGGALVSWEGGSVLLEGVRKTDLAQDDFMFAQQSDLPPGARVPSGAAPERSSPSSDGPSIGSSTLSGAQKSFDAGADDALGHGGLSFAFDEYKVAVGTAKNDLLQGGSAMDNMFGRAGDDRLAGGAGDDVLNGDAGSDTLDGGAGGDQLDGGMGDDKLRGGTGNDMLMGREGNDALNGGAGHDMLDGGMGNDTLRGGGGADAFIVDPMSGNDVVLDFEATGKAQGAFDHVAFNDISAEDLAISESCKGTRISWDVNDDGRSEGSILLQGVEMADLRQSDFMFVDGPQFVPGIDAYGSYYIFPA